MILQLETPAMLFPAITLLLLAYTNRFLALSQLIRSLHREYQDCHAIKALNQIKRLRLRVSLIRLMQASGVVAIIFCIITIFLLLASFNQSAFIYFIISLIIFLISIICSLIEILLSNSALNIVLSDLEQDQ